MHLISVGNISGQTLSDDAQIVRHGFAESRFGELFIASTSEGIVALEFTDGGREEAVENFRRLHLDRMNRRLRLDSIRIKQCVDRKGRRDCDNAFQPKEHFPCRMLEDDVFARKIADIMSGNDSIGSTAVGSSTSITVCMDGTPFQKEVWNAILTIPFGQTATYGQLSERIGRPKAVRAVASAVAQNRIAYLVPCHRVVRAGGRAGEYRWDSARKAAIIEWEKNVTCNGEKCDGRI